MNDDRFDEILEEVARKHNSPPPAPREQIWAAVNARRRSMGAGSIGSSRRFLALIGAAALLLIGVGLGRWSTRERAAPPPERAALAPGGMDEGVEAPMNPAYRLAATRYLSRTEALLMEFGSDGSDAGSRDVASWAREMLGELRLLLDSKASEDPELRRLFLDLELVLARIVHLEGSVAERDQVRSNMDERAILMRIRNRVSAGI